MTPVEAEDQLCPDAIPDWASHSAVCTYGGSTDLGTSGNAARDGTLLANITRRRWAPGTDPKSGDRRQYVWDAEPERSGDRMPASTPFRSQNSLRSITPINPAAGDFRQEFNSDWRGRRTRIALQSFTNPTQLAVWRTQQFLYQGWNPILFQWTRPAGQGSTAQSGLDRYIRGQDVSGTMQGAGGVGGLLFRQAKSKSPPSPERSTEYPPTSRTGEIGREVPPAYSPSRYELLRSKNPFDFPIK